MAAVAWHWELTPLQALGGYKIWLPPSVPVRNESTPLAGIARERVEGTALTMQCGVSSRSLAVDMQAIREFAPELPDPGQHGDRRSGLLLFDGERIVGFYVIEGFRVRESHRVWIDPSYRGERLGQRVLLEWQKRVPRCEAPGQKLNPGGVRTFLDVRARLYQWAVDQGYAVPDRVRRELESGMEAAVIRRKLDKVLATGEPQII